MSSFEPQQLSDNLQTRNRFKLIILQKSEYAMVHTGSNMAPPPSASTYILNAGLHFLTKLYPDELETCVTPPIYVESLSDTQQLDKGMNTQHLISGQKHAKCRRYCRV